MNALEPIRLTFESVLRRTFPVTLLPEVVEKDTDSAWAQWDQVVAEHDCRDARPAWTA